MGLTRARAWQIFDIDYKQAVRAITLTNITLSGSAPSTVDGVNLAQDDRVLVAGQSTGSQNGIYIVTTLGTGSNGTWTRAVDGNQTGEIQAGMIVMVTEGNTYDDTQWKLTTDDPITVGVTSLTFEQVGATLAGNFLPTANATYTLGNSTQQWKSLYVSGNTIYIGDSTITSNATGISLTSPGGAIFTVSGTSAANTIGSFGIVSATGNVIAGNLNTSGLVSASGTITGANITGSNFLTGGLISAAATITGGNLQTGGTISATGNITGGNILGGANVNATTHTGTTVSVSSNITGGNLFTGGEISAAGRIQGANIVGGNLTTVGLISATGNVTGNYFIGNGSQLTGIVVSAGDSIVNGTSNVSVLNNSNVLVSIGGTANIAVFHANGLRVANTLSALNVDSASADVAERYLADADYPVGTVLVIGGEQELTQSTGYSQTTVVGTVSEQPALTMNRDLQGDHVVSLAFLGRVPCRVIGNINRGDMLVSSNTKGTATKMESYVPGAVLGKALESYASDTPGIIEIIVGRL